MIKSQPTKQRTLKNTKANKIRHIKKALENSDNKILKERLRYWETR